MRWRRRRYRLEVFLVGQIILNFPFPPVSEPFAWRPAFYPLIAPKEEAPQVG